MVVDIMINIYPLHHDIIKIAVGFDFQVINEIKFIEEKDEKSILL